MVDPRKEASELDNPKLPLYFGFFQSGIGV